MAAISFRVLLQHTSFVYFWLARVLGTIANQMLMVAVGWQMYDLTHSAWDLGLVGLFQFAPVLALTLPAGHVVDRVHRGRVFAVCMLAQAATALVLFLSIHQSFASRELILLLSVVLGVARSFQMPSQQALIPQLVPAGLLSQAISLSASGMQVAIVCGPALGGLLYASGATVVYSSSLGLLLLAGGLGLSTRYEHEPPKGETTLRSVFAGFRFVWHHKPVLGALTLDLFAVLLGGATALLPIFARDILHTGPEGLGLLRAAPAAGAFLTSLALFRWPVQRRAGPLLLISVAVFGVATVVFGVSQHFYLSLAALMVTGAGDYVSVVIRQTLVQAETPNEIRGRVSAVNSIFIGASNQLGEFESGATAAWLGPVGSVVLGGVGTVVIALAWIRLFPTLSRRDHLVTPASPVTAAKT